MTTTTSDLPLVPGARGEPVRDIQRRLARLGFAAAGDGSGVYGGATEAALRAFQESRGLRSDGVCGQQTWSALVEAGYQLGDRFLYLRAPMLRGEDVAELQRRLGALGFDAGRVDGIFGSRTAGALLDFQRNAGLTPDGICGPDALAALARLGERGPSATVATVREEETLRDARRELRGRRIVVGETGGLAALADALGRALLDQGAVVAVLHHPDESRQADEANTFAAEVFLAVALTSDRACRAAYYAAEGFESVGGRRLAHLIADELVRDLPDVEATVRGMRLPILRETRMPAVLCELGPPEAAVEHAATLVAGLARAVADWAAAPIELP